MVRRMLLVTLASAAVLGVAAGAYVRLSPMDPSIWHVLPGAGARSGRPNEWLVAEGGDAGPVRSSAPPAVALTRLDGAAMAEAGTERLAGSPEEGFVTWVQRSRLLGYPDAISARAVAEGEGSRIAIWSRSRYGYSDMGVNRARVERWLDAAGL